MLELDRNQQIAEADLTTLANLMSAYRAAPTCPLNVPSLVSLNGTLLGSLPL